MFLGFCVWGFTKQQNQINFPQTAPNVASDEIPVQIDHLQTQKGRQRWSGVVTPTLKSDKIVQSKAMGNSAIREYSELAYLRKRAITVFLKVAGVP